MKSKDIGLLAVIAIISGAIAVFVSGWIVPKESKTQSVEVIEPISANFDRPPEAYFNPDSVNPTREIQIGQDPDSNPFNEN
jgi:hypothetical protein